MYRLWKDGAAGSEYFLVENRQQTGFDASLPGSGLLIWHIDEAQPGNTDENHYKVALMQADDLRDLELNHNRGDAGDCYPGSALNTAFNGTSSPNSKSYANANTCVGVNAISASGSVMTANLQVKCRTKVVEKPIRDKDFKERKEVRKDFKDKERKEVRKDFKDKDFKDFKELKEFEKPLSDNPGKPVIDKAATFDKGGDGKFTDGKFADGKFADGRPGGLGDGGPRREPADLEARLTALENALGLSGPPASPAQFDPFIGSELRPDLSQGAFGAEEDQSQLQQEMLLGSAHAKRVFDSKVKG